MRSLVLATALALPFMPLHAAGGGDNSSTTPPKQTETTQDCFTERQWDPDQGKYVKLSRAVNGVWDASIEKCVRPDRSGYLGEDVLYGAVRELAYAGRYDSAQQVLDEMPDQASGRVLTYRGFIARKQGALDVADLFYTRAIEADPDNILARSYMGQGFVAAGDKVAAKVQLREIRVRDGTDSWAYASLAEAIRSGTTYDY